MNSIEFITSTKNFLSKEYFMKTHDLPLSVILLTHDQADILSMQISALECQRNIKASDFEIIVTDDSSKQSEILKIWDILSRTSLNCHLLQQRSDRFWATGARNNAIREARGNLLLFLDGDMIPEIDVLSKHVSMQNGQRNHIVAGHRLRRRIEFQSIEHTSEFDQVLKRFKNTGIFDPLIAQWQLNEERKRLEFLRSKHSWRIVLSCHMSVNASPEVLFDEYFKGWGPEDWELAYRLTQHHGYTVNFAPDIIAYEIDHLGQGIGNVFRLRTKQAIIDYLRNTFYFFDKCPGQEVEDVFWGLRKLELRDDSWIVTPNNKSCDLNQRVIETRRWLAINKHYEAMIT